MVVRLEQPEKADSSMEARFSGKLMVVRPEALKMAIGIFFTPMGIEMDNKSKHAKKASSPREIKLSGSVIALRR